jgi:hypothetical protein
MTGQASTHTVYVRGLKTISEQARDTADLVHHDPEKGRILEGIAENLLSRFLPKRYSVGTGIIITSDGRASRQIDIVIYDNQKNAPLMFENNVGLFPVECVYGTIEVKSRIDGTVLKECADAIATIRNFKGSKTYYEFVTVEEEDGTKYRVRRSYPDTLAPKSYVFAFNCKYQSAEGLRRGVQAAAKSCSTHIHGVVVLENDWFVRQVPFDPAFEAANKDGLQHFLLALLGELESMELGAADMSKYFSGIGKMKRYFETPKAVATKQSEAAT